MSEAQISIPTGDGDCPSHVFTRDRPGQYAGVILYMDGLGIRPTILRMGRRLADHGYVVLVPDLFYRAGPYSPLEPKLVFASGDVTGTIGHLLESTDNQRAAADTEAFLAYFDTRDDIVGPRVGTTGYCMGGAMSLSAAGTYPDRVAAAASFHGGNLATDSKLSPHWLAPQITARVYVAGADHDESYPPAMAERLEQIFREANVDHRCEIYPNVRHGFTMDDFPVYDEVAAERHWQELFTLFDNTLSQ